MAKKEKTKTKKKKSQKPKKVGEDDSSTREVVVPGELLAEGMDYLPSQGTFRHGENIHAKKLGVLDKKGRVVKVLPLSGVYQPSKGDNIIGQITEFVGTGWTVDINAPHEAYLRDKEAMPKYSDTRMDPAKFYKEFDVLHAKILHVSNKGKSIHLGMRGREYRKLEPGIIVKVAPAKVPRLIGKRGSMINMIKKKTDCKILVGENGVVHVNGEAENVMRAVRAIRKVGELAHTHGLTEKIEKMLSDKK